MNREKSQKHYRLLLLASVALIANACSDDAGSGKVDGQCGETVCLSTQQCVEGVCKDLCGTEICSDTQVCEESKCVEADPCRDKACPEGQVCLAGECVSESVDLCKDKTCPEGQVCMSSDGSCVVVDACQNRVCPDGQQCLNGQCLDEACIVDQAEKVCGENQMCHKGECIDDGCLDIECKSEFQCVKGICVESACIDKQCPDGTTCSKGNCVENSCLEVECGAGELCQGGECIFAACLDVPECAQGKVCTIDGTCQFDTDPAIVILYPDELTTDENGKTLTLYVSLNHEPSADVALSCTTDPEDVADEVAVSCENIIFNAENYQYPVEVVVTGLGDNVIDGDQLFSILFKTTSTDEEFNDLSQKTSEMTNLDVDVPGVIFKLPDVLMTTEDKDSVEIQVALNTKPSADVTFSVTSSNVKEGTVSAESLTFTTENWSEYQTITVTGVDDDLIDGNVSYSVIFGNLVSEDTHFNGAEVSPIELYNRDNDKAALSVYPSDGIVTDETGVSSELAISLTTKPDKDVVISIQVSDDTEAKAEVQEITITPDDWNTPHIVQIIGVDDDEIDGNIDYEIKLSTTSEDRNYSDLEDVTLKAVNKDADSAGFATHFVTLAEVHETGSEAEIEVKLSAKPTADVTVTAVSGDEGEVIVLTEPLIFTSENWNTAQKVTVKGVADNQVDGNQTTAIKLTSVSDDAHFNSVISSEFNITTIDDDSAELLVTSTSVSISEKDGKTSFSVHLTSKPTAPVTIQLTSTNTHELVPDVESITIKPDDWNKDVSVSLSAVDDILADGTREAIIHLAATSEDAHFNGKKADTATIYVTDNESVSISIAAEAKVLNPTSLKTTVSISLSTEPVDNVVVTLATTNPITAALGETKFTFTPDNWNVPQTTTLSATDLSKATAAVTNEKITGKAESKGAYNGVNSNEISIKIVAFTSQTFAYTGKESTITLLPGNYRLQVWGAQGVAQYEGGIGGKGGYSYGTYTLASKSTLYVNVGGVTYNGGGKGQTSGGGATHIALESGVLSTFAAKQDKVLLVAGGGGGGERTAGGYGGGSSGGIGAVGGLCSPAIVSPGGGSATAGGSGGSVNNGYGTAPTGSFGQGASGYGNLSSADPGSGGGGGWYGGGGIPYCGGGGGGSGHISSAVTGATIAGNISFVSPGGSNETGHPGTGYAIITLVE